MLRFPLALEEGPAMVVHFVVEETTREGYGSLPILSGTSACTSLWLLCISFPGFLSVDKMAVSALSATSTFQAVGW